MDYQYEKALITDMVMKNETKKEIEKLLNSIKEKLGITAFNIIQEEIRLINITIDFLHNWFKIYIS